MTTQAEFRQALVEISTALRNASTISSTNPAPLLAAVDQVRSFVDAMADAVTGDEARQVPGELIRTAPTLRCLLCHVAAHNARRVGQPEPEIRPAALVVNGNGICVEHLTINDGPPNGGLLLPAQQPPMPPGMPPANGRDPWPPR